MKLKALPLIISGVAAIASTQAMAAPTVYGKANVSVQHNEVKDQTSTTSVNSNASRIGLKGSEKLSDSLKAIYKLEYQVDVDGKSSGFKHRNTYVGLQGGFGTIAAGRHDTPFKMAQGKVDQFNDLKLGDIKTIIDGEDRVNNAVWYATPKMGAVSAVAALVTDETGNTANTAFSGMVSFKQDGIYAAIAHNKNVNAAETSSTRLVGQFNAGDFGVGAIYQMADLTKKKEETGIILSGYFKMDKTKLKLQYGMSEQEEGKATTDKTLITIGADQKLSKRTKVYGYYSMMDSESKNDGTKTGESDASTLGVGLEVKF